MQRDNANIVNFDGCWGVENQELESQVGGPIGRGKELNRVIAESSCRIVASIHGVYRLMVEHDAQEAYRRITFVEVSPESQVVRHTGNKAQVLAETCGMCICLWRDRADKVEFVGKVRVVARRAD